MTLLHINYLYVRVTIFTIWASLSFLILIMNVHECSGHLKCKETSQVALLLVAVYNICKSTHIRRGVDVVGVDHHWRGVGLPRKGSTPIKHFAIGNVSFQTCRAREHDAECNLGVPLTRLMFWYSMLNASATDYHSGTAGYTAWHTAQSLNQIVLMYYPSNLTIM